MDVRTHARAQGGIHHAVLGQRWLASEIGANHGGLKMLTIVADDLGASAVQAVFDPLLDGV